VEFVVARTLERLFSVQAILSFLSFFYVGARPMPSYLQPEGYELPDRL